MHHFKNQIYSINPNTVIYTIHSEKMDILNYRKYFKNDDKKIIRHKLSDFHN